MYKCKKCINAIVHTRLVISPPKLFNSFLCFLCLSINLTTFFPLGTNSESFLTTFILLILPLNSFLCCFKCKDAKLQRYKMQRCKKCISAKCISAKMHKCNSAYKVSHLSPEALNCCLCFLCFLCLSTNLSTSPLLFLLLTPQHNQWWPYLTRARALIQVWLLAPLHLTIIGYLI